MKISQMLFTGLTVLAFAIAAKAQDTSASRSSDDNAMETTEVQETTTTPAQPVVIAAPLPRTMASPMRLIPVVGVSSFANSKTLKTDNFNDGFSAGLFADFGEHDWNFETGLLTLKSNTSSSANTAAVTINTWGVPLLAKWNLSGKPHETVFLKAGAMPFLANGQDVNDFNVMGVGGVGANIPLGRNSSLLLDASYNRLFSQSGDLTNYQGLALLAGLSLNL